MDYLNSVLMGVFVILSLLTGKTTSFSLEGSVYKNASHYWPLDYITGIKDVVTMSEATIYGMNGVSLTGKGDAYMEIQLGKAAVRFGEYDHVCLTDLKQCKSGMTLSFWLNCQVSMNDSVQFDLITLTSNFDEPIIKITFLADKEHHKLQFIVNVGILQHKATIILWKQHWTHVTMTYSTKNLSIYANGVLTNTGTISYNEIKSGKSSTLMIGTLAGLGSFQGPKILFDKIAIWDTKLDDGLIKDVVLKSYGDFSKPSCSANGSSLKVTWNAPFDPYKQIDKFVIMARSDKKSYTYDVSSNSTETTLHNLDINALYEVKIAAQLFSGLSFNSSIIQCSTNQTKQKQETESGFQLIALSTDKIRLIWSSNSRDRSYAVGVSYSTAGVPAVYRLFVSKTFLNYTVQNLKDNTLYEFTVFLYSSQGINKLKPKSIKTKRIIKLATSPIRMLTARNISWNSVILHWLPPVNYSDPAVQYKIIIKSQQNNKMFLTTRSTYEINGLLEDSEYIVQVEVGAEQMGFLNESVAVVFRTQVRFPAPSDVLITNVQWNSALIAWQPIHRHEPIFYKVTYHNEKDSSETAIIIKPMKNEIHLSDLEQQMGYFVTLKSGNGTVFARDRMRKAFFITPDRDECQDSSHTCSKNSRCINTKGSFLCTCLPGYYEKSGACLMTKEDISSCDNDTTRNVNWPRTSIGQTAFSRCPPGSEGIAIRRCKMVIENKAKWLPPDFSDCISAWMKKFNSKMRSRTDNSSILMKSLANEYEKQSNLVGGDIQSVVNAIGDIVNLQQTESDSKSKKLSSQEATSIAKNLVLITDDLLSTKSSSSWEGLPKGKQTSSASGIMKTVEDMASVCSLSMGSNSVEKSESLFIKTSNAVLNVKSVRDSADLHFEDISHDGNQTIGSSISIPSTDSSQSSGLRSVYFGSFRNIGGLLGTEMKNSHENNDEADEDDVTVGSSVIAASLFPPEKQRFQKPVVIVHRLPKVNFSASLTCVFWNFSQNGNGFWSSDGCQLRSSNESHAVCHCFHLTNFAVLMTVTKAPLTMKREHERATYWITIVCICISLVALVLSFITFCCVKALQSSRNTTHKHLVVALFLAQLLFLCGIDKTANQKVCRAIAVTTHYLFLVAFTVMGQEGFVLYMMLVKVYSRSGGYGNGKMLIACWTLPFIIVGVTFAIDYKGYGNKNYCWLNPEDGFIWSFVGPVISIIAVNVVFMVLAIRVMAEKSKHRDILSEEIWYWIKCCSMLVTILGLCWILGIFNLNQESVAIVYVFSILNGSQGLAIFVFICLLDPRVKDVYYKHLCCNRRDKATITSRTMSATKSTLPSRQSKEVNENTLLRNNSDKLKAVRQLKAVSMEYQEIVVDFSEDEVPYEL